MRQTVPPTPPASPIVKSIQVLGFSDQVRDQLLARLPIHEGDVLTPDTIQKASAAVHEFDEHLAFRFNTTAGEAEVVIRAPNYGGAPAPPGTIKVGGAVQQAMLISQAKPIYPELAKQARIQGTVSFIALIGQDGHVKDLQVIEGHGHPLLVGAAMEAAKTWVYRPTLLNGNPVDVQTQIDVNFTLSQ